MREQYLSRARETRGSSELPPGAVMTGRELRDKRLRVGLLVKELADEAGYTANYLYGMESGRVAITARAAAVLLEAIKVRSGRQTDPA